MDQPRPEVGASESGAVVEAKGRHEHDLDRDDGEDEGGGDDHAATSEGKRASPNAATDPTVIMAVTAGTVMSGLLTSA